MKDEGGNTGESGGEVASGGVTPQTGSPPNVVRGIPAAEIKCAPYVRQFPGVWRLVWSDYCRTYHDRDESERRRAVLCLPRMLTNSSMHLTVLLRLCMGTSPWLTWIWRRLMLALHGSDCTRDTVIGPGLTLPHPMGLCLGPATVIGRDVVIQHQVSIGPVTTNWRPGPISTVQIGDEVTMFPGSFVLGEITVGDGALIGANAVVVRDVPAGHIATSLRKGSRPATPAERGQAEAPRKPATSAGLNPR